ncbi:DEAD/DEAH box helicase family protein [Rothia sp. AR01]|uniref:DEAD/DEAH box helicase family protein n=1 Tax=Rothia santali TaxID=2949643 RepID=A0A9X2HA64_9MICC|nr:helicase-related protein [Rothia santali]MCP3425834.1 DEAD/DEAH box helicase family protein [Rothia santali]
MPSGAKARARANLDAVEVLRELEEQRRYATAGEQDILVRFSSWGACPQMFEDREDWAELQQRMQEVMTAEEISAARIATMNAHFTDPLIAQGLWGAMHEAGVVEGTVLDPGCGVGNLLGHARQHGNWAGQDTRTFHAVGVELDPLSAKIAAALYPQETIRSESFENTRIPAGAVSAAVGNVPFAQYRPYDPIDNPENLSLHNYFIHKSMKRMAPGGYGAFITSSWTMDAKNTTARAAIAEHSDLVGAVRLPNGIFQRVAGATVQSDVLVFRRREEATPPNREAQQSWVGAGSETGELDGEQVTVPTSRYFQEHPELVLGTPELQRIGMAQQPALVVAGGEVETVSAQMSNLLKQQMATARETGLGYAPVLDPEVSTAAFAPGGFVEPGDVVDARFEGQVRVDEAGTVQRLAGDMTWKQVPATRGVSEAERRALVGLKAQVRTVIDRQQAGEEVAEPLRVLHERYDRYAEEYGSINRYQITRGAVPSDSSVARAVERQRKKWAEGFTDLTAAERAELQPDEELAAQWRAEAETPREDRKRQPHLSFLRSDPDYGKLLGLEVFDEENQQARKSGYFAEGHFRPVLSARSAETAADALAITLDEGRHVGLARVGQLLGVDEETARQRLGELVFDDPQTGELVPAVRYLSGDVREKLHVAREAAEGNDAYAPNVHALEQVVPPWVSLDAVAMQPGVQFVTPKQYEQFSEDVLGASATIDHAPGAEGGWLVEQIGRSRLSARVRYEFGTEKANPSWILGRLMNNTPVTITKTVLVDDKERRVPDEKATALARQKASALSAAFVTWAKAVPERKAVIEEQYNAQMNAYVPPNYQQTGDELGLPGLATDKEPHPYQREAVARIVNEPAVLLNHVVGAGKTGSMIMGAMELRRTGVANKPWVVVPNHLVDQVTRDFAQWYPASNVLTIESGADATERRRYAALSAAGDWDAVICPQSTFSKISVSPGKLRRWLEEDLEQLHEDKRKAAAESGGKVRVKALAGAIKTAEKRLARIQSGKDVGVPFEETGCDYLFIDEAHHFKNLRRQSAFQELDNPGSDKATDLDYILRTLREMKSTREGSTTETPAVVTFATGTPVANSLAEEWVMGHYLRPDLQEKFGVGSIGDFGTTFTRAEDSVEVKPSGVGFRIVNRVAAFANVEAMMQMRSVYTSTVTKDQIPGHMPAVADGKMRAVEREASPAVQDYVADLVERAENPGQDDYLVEILGRARKVALDPRTVGLEAEEDGGRPRSVAEDVMRIHTRTAERTYLDAEGNPSATPGGLQLLFCDMGTPGGASGFNMYEAIRDELVEAGMEPGRIAFIHDARTDSERGELFARARRGDLSVLIGSTEKMGTGMNVQDRVTAVHHVDIPWRPADLEQREGRAFRQGNQNAEVEVVSHLTSGTFDAYMWQTIARKSSALDQLNRGTAGNTVEDIGSLTMSSQEMVAAASGDPRIATWLELNNEVLQLENLQHAEVGNRQSFERGIEASRHQIGQLEGFEQSLEAARGKVPAGDFRMQVGAEVFDNRAEAGNRLVQGLRQAAVKLREEPNQRFRVARAGGLVLVASHEQAARGRAVHLSFEGVQGVYDRVLYDDLLEGNVSGQGLASRIWNRATGVDEKLAEVRQSLEAARAELVDVEDALDGNTGFSQQERLDEVLLERDLLGAQLGLEAPDSMTGQEPESEFLDDDEAWKLYGSLEEIEGEDQLRDGDVVEVTKGGGGFSTGMYVARRLDNHLVQLRPEDSTDEEDWTRLTYSVSWSMVRRQRSALSPWDERVLATTEADETYTGRQLKRRQNIEPSGQVIVRGRRFDGESELAEPEIVSGTLVAVDAAPLAPVVTLIPEGEQEQQRFKVRANTSEPVMIRPDVYDAEELARQAAEAEAEQERQRNRVSIGRALPGDVLLEDVDDVGERGWTLDADGTQFVEPESERTLGGTHRRFAAFDGAVQPGRNLSEEEQAGLFGNSLEDVSASDVRVGDVLDGRRLDSKRGVAGDVVIVAVDGYSTLELRYRAVEDPPWEQATEVKKREDTKVGPVKHRRFGALSHTEKVMLATDADQVPVERLDERVNGSWVMVKDTTEGSGRGAQAWVTGRLEGVNHDGPPKKRWIGTREIGPDRTTLLNLSVDGQAREVQFTSPREEVIVLTGAYPGEGIDFRGVAVEAAAAAAVAAEQAASSELSGFELGAAAPEELLLPPAAEAAESAAAASEVGTTPEAAAEPPAAEPETAAVETDDAPGNEEDASPSVEEPSSTAESPVEAGAQAEPAFEEDLEVDEVQPGDRVRVSGTDAISGGSIDEVEGTLLEVTEGAEEEAGTISVQDEAGQTHHVLAVGEKLDVPRTGEDWSRPGDDRQLRSDGQSLTTAQVRPGDRVRSPGGSWHEVYDVQRFNGQFIDITAMGQDHVISTARFHARDRLQVDPYPEAEQLGTMKIRQARSVRVGDVVDVGDVGGEVLYAASFDDGVTEYQLLTEQDEFIHQRCYSENPVGVRMPLCAEPRSGIRGPGEAVPVRSLQPGDLIHTRAGAAPAVVNRVEEAEETVSVRYQLLGDKLSPPRSLVKGSGEGVKIYSRSEVATEPPVPRAAAGPGPEVAAVIPPAGPGMD